MSSPKEKAAELIEKYYSDKCFNGSYGEDYNAKQCALIAVQELIEESEGMFEEARYKYWNEVYSETIKL